MPYPNVAAARAAGFPTRIDGVGLTDAQVNALAAMYDAIKEDSSVDEPMAVAIAQFKRGHKVEDDHWVEASAELAEADLEVEDLPNVEVLRTGTHVDRSGKVFKVTAETLKEIAQSMAHMLARGYKSLVTLTHDKHAWMPTLGNAENFRTEPLKDGGHMLVADFRRVPKLLTQIIRAGGYQNVSAKVVRPGRVGDYTSPWAVEHVAVLGVQHPAATGGLKTLDQIATLYRPMPNVVLNELPEQGFEFEDAGVIEDTEGGAPMDEKVEQNDQEKVELAAKLEAAEAEKARLTAELAERDAKALEAKASEFVTANATRLGADADTARALFTELSRSAASVEFSDAGGGKTTLNLADGFAKLVARLPEVVPTKEEGAAEFPAPGEGEHKVAEFDGECERPSEDGVLNVELAAQQAKLAKEISETEHCDMATAMSVALARLTKKQTVEQ